MVDSVLACHSKTPSLQSTPLEDKINALSRQMRGFHG